MISLHSTRQCSEYLILILLKVHGKINVPKIFFIHSMLNQIGKKVNFQMS